MKMLLFTFLILVSANCFAESPSTQNSKFVDEFTSVDSSGCSCEFYIPVGRGHGFKPILFMPCDQTFALMKLNDRFTFFERTDPSLNIENEVKVKWRNPSYKFTLNLRKSGTGEESVSYEGDLKVNKDKQQQIIKIVGACGL